MDKDRLEELMPLYALGLLEGAESREAEEALASGDDYAAELYDDYRRVVDLLPYSSRARMPDPSLRAQLLSEIRDYREELVKAPREKRASFLSSFRLISLSLGGALAAILIVFLFTTNRTLRQELAVERAVVAELEEKLGNTESEIEVLRATLEEKMHDYDDLHMRHAHLDAITEYLEDPGVMVVGMNNLSTHKDAGGGVLLDADDNEALFYCLDLPKAPEGKSYQWWVDADGNLKSIGVFDVDSGGTSIIRIEKISEYGNISKFVVTIESAGGSDKPTGDTVFAREI